MYELRIVLDDVNLYPIRELSIELTEAEAAALMPDSADRVGSVQVQVVRRHQVGRMNLPVTGYRYPL